VPIKLGDRTVGFLQTGQVALKEPSEWQFKKITQKLVEWGSQVDLKQLRETYFHSKVFSARQYAGLIRLLIFLESSFR
jgi:ligand-binding sensor protein